MVSNVSIIIPVYNTEPRLLDRAVESALAQDYLKEIILVDDGSCEITAKDVDRLGEKYSDRIIALHKMNGGASSARNAGLDIASGCYIAFLDSDDILLPGFCSEAMQIALNHDADLVFGGMEYHYLTGRSKYVGNGELRNRVADLEGEQIKAVMGSMFNASALTRAGLRPAMYVSQCSAIYKRSAIGRNRFLEGIKISEDRLFNYDVLSCCKKVSISGRSWYQYIQNPGSASQSLRLESKNELLCTAKAFEQLKSGDCQLDNDIDVGIIECFQQTLSFSILRRGFHSNFGMSEHALISELLLEPVYREAFARAKSLGLKRKLLKYLFQHGMARSISIMFHANKALSDVRNLIRISARA